MGNLFIVVYNAPDSKKIKNIYRSKSNTKPFIQAVASHSWHYDVGDDPALFWNKKHMPLTWGICRTNIRNCIDKNDVVMYYCFCPTCKSYFFSGIATVKQKISQTQIWTTKRFSMFKNYFNILIKKNTNTQKWQHNEPLFLKSSEHSDWLLRISDQKKQYRNFNLVKGRIESYLSPQKNYVVFKSQSSETYILNKQIKVASLKKGRRREKWMNNREVDTIKNLTFNRFKKTTNGPTRKRNSLRVHTRNYAHPPIRIELSENELKEWKRELIDLLKKIDKNNSQHLKTS